VLVILGGSDAGSSLAPVLQMLKDQLPEDAQVTVAGVQPAGETPGPARIRWVRSPAEVASEMADADLGISAGGMASYELACLGVPALLLPATGEELPVSLELQALGAAVCLRLPGEWTCATLAHEFRQLAHSRPLRESMSAKGRSIFDGLGANRIATALVAALEAPAPAA
jgi:spore coat polysaccharide biosynthesis predicted glycosyltransferase SpsG